MSLQFADRQADFWGKHGYEVHFLTADGPEIDAFLSKNRVVHHVIPFKRSFSIIWATYCLFLLVRYFLKYRPCIVHGNTPNAAFLAMVAAWLTKVPVRIYEMHGLPLETASSIKFPFYWLIEKITCSLSTKVMAVSSSLREAALKNKLVDRFKIHTNHNGSCNGIDAQRVYNPEFFKTSKLRATLSIPKSYTVIGFVGRLTLEKGFRELLEAWKKVHLNYPKTKLVIVGTLDERKGIPNKLLKEILDDASICYVGYVKNVAEYYHLIDFLVLPSYREGLGNAVLEAAAMKKPAVVSKVTGLKNAVIENETGLFCKVRSADDLADKMMYYLENPQFVRTHGINARKRIIKKFYPDDLWQAKLRVYERLTDGNKSVSLPNVSSFLQTFD